MALRRSYRHGSGSPARRPLALLNLEDRLTPSFSLHAPLSPEAVRQFAETRADMYTPEAAVPPSPTGEAADLELAAFNPVRINLRDLSTHLADAPQEFETGRTKILAVPRPDGRFDRFNVWEVQMMEPGLATQFPDFKTWRGQGIDDPTATLAASLTGLGFHAQVLSPRGGWYVDPYYHLETDVYAAYFKKDLTNKHAATWTETLVDDHPEPEEEDQPTANRLQNGETLRIYRAAVAATVEYTAFHGGTVAGGMAGIVAANNRVSGLFETELSIRLVLVANNALLVYTATDNYSNNDGFAMLGQNQTNVTNVIGNANYDIGHVYSTGGGGVAGLGVVGLSGQKARGVTGSGSPTGDAFWVDYVIHEMGHQFGGNHTFNGVNAGGNRHGPTGHEPGSGSTIMAYAGIMGSDDLQSNSDPYFHAASLDEISNHTLLSYGGGNVQTPTDNNLPVVDAGPDVVIPAGTAFALTGSATDADGDALTYNWEQFNDYGSSPWNGVPLGTPDADDGGDAPLFRSFTATASPTRTFPRTPNFSAAEVRPTQAQAMNFRLTVRDNRTAGAYNTDDKAVTVVDTGGVFAVTFPNTNVSLPGNSTQRITWNVAGTDGAPINVSQVNILLSTNGGTSYATVLAAGVPNVGEADVVLPNISTTQARIKVQPVDNVFFDVSDVNFSIAAVPRPTAVASPAVNRTYTIGETIPITVTFNSQVNVAGVPQLALNSGGTANYVSGSGGTTLTFNYVVGPLHQSADLDYASAAALTLNGGTIKAVSTGFDVSLVLPDPGAAGSLGANENIVIDGTDDAVVTGVSSPLAAGTYGTGTVVPITVTFDRAVVVTGTPQLALNSEAAAVAAYVSGSGTAALTFHYTVGVTDTSPDLDYTSTAALSLNGGTIQSPLTAEDAALTLAAPGAAGSLGANNALVIGLPGITLSASAFTFDEDEGTVSIAVVRTGAATGAVSVDYTVAAGTADETDDYTVSPLSDALSWGLGEGGAKYIVLDLDDDGVSEGRETLGITLSNLQGTADLGIDTAAVTILQSNGLPPGKFTDADGDVGTVSLTPKLGFGTLLVYLTNGAAPISLLETTGTSSTRSVVKVAVKKARATSLDLGTMTVGGVVGSGVKTLDLAKSQLVGDGIHLDGMVQTLKLDSVAADVDVDIAGTPVAKKKTNVTVKHAVANGSDFDLHEAPVGTFRAAAFGDGRIAADRVGLLAIKGNFGGDVDVAGLHLLPKQTALGTMTVGGVVDGSSIAVNGVVGSVTVGSFLNSRLFAGYAGDDNGGGTFDTVDPIGAVNTFRTTSKTGTFTNSSVIAGKLGTVTLANVDADNGGTDKFGIYADTSIKAVIVKEPRITYRNPTTLDGFQDFEIEVV